MLVTVFVVVRMAVTDEIPAAESAATIGSVSAYDQTGPAPVAGPEFSKATENSKHPISAIRNGTSTFVNTISFRSCSNRTRKSIYKW